MAKASRTTVDDKRKHKSQATTIIDVAKAAGVSYVTVSRVANDQRYVKPQTRQRVLKAMAKLGYVANRQARILRGGSSNVVGLLVHELATAYIGAIIRGIVMELEASKYELLLYTTHRGKEKEAEYVRTLTQGMADGLLLVLPRNPEMYLQTLRERHFPYVLIDHQGIDKTGPAVGASNLKGSYEATKYLLELGHRRIGFIAGIMEMGCAQDRLEGYKQALIDAGVDYRAEWVKYGDFFQPAGYALAQQLLSLPHRPTAIVASNDVMAFGVMDAARECELHIPEDISIIGFDGIPQSANTRPALTTVRQPLEEMGRLATQMLLAAIKNPDHVTEYKELPTEMVIRESCSPPCTR
jgi:LacI family transcriptional regulator